MSMRTLTYLIGEPCTGKSSLVRRAMARGQFEYRPVKYVPHHVDPVLGLMVLGRYDEEHQFPGTDRLSMGVKPYAMDLIGHTRCGLLVEGARLASLKFFREVEEMGLRLRVGLVTCDPDELACRRALERSQTEKFLKIQATKTRNLSEWPHEVLKTDGPEDVERALDWIMG